MASLKTLRRQSRRRRIRSRVHGTADRPRLAVHKSLTRLTAQLIDDTLGQTVAYAVSTASALSKKSKGSKGKKASGSLKNIEAAKKLGAAIATKAKEKKIAAVVFDRSGYKYHGRVKALADAAREGGLQF